MLNTRSAVVVDDDKDVGDAITHLLDQSGFNVTTAQTGADALSLIAEHGPDLVTLDLSLPDIDGVEVCRQIRSVSDCYVIVVSARADEVDRLIGLEVGADDYLVKPFSMRELQARVAALFRRPRRPVALIAPPGHPGTPRRTPGLLAVADSEPGVFEVPVSTGAIAAADGPRAGVEVIGCPDLTIYPSAREVLVGGEPIELTRTEFDLLLALVRNAGVVMDRHSLLRAVWASEFVPANTHVVDVHLANLRRKLRDADRSKQWIRTVRGVGFRFDPCCDRAIGA